MKIAFCFAGQGSQYVGMGKDFYTHLPKVKEIYDAFPEIKELCFEDKLNVLNQTAYAQKAMLLTSYVIAQSLKENNIVPEYALGLSLGEYTALAFSNVWNLKDAIEIVTKRGEIMQNALPLGTTKMTAVIGLKREVILDALKGISGVCEIANYNCPGQIVITGENASVEAAKEELTKRNALKLMDLNVSGAFHSSLLKDASIKLRSVLDKYDPKTPEYKIVYNVSGKEETDLLNDILQKQICNSVYFEDSIQYLLSQGVDTFIEIGPGKTLTGFIKRINRNVKVLTVQDYESFEQALQELKS